MKNSIFYTILLFIITQHIYSQKEFIDSVITPIQKENLYREKAYIHLNKTKYFVGKPIWFTFYVGKDHDNTPSNYTTNFNVNLLDEDGNVIESKVFLTENGIGFGDFLIDENLKTGKYYIQGYTNYMKNFGSTNYYLQEIQIKNFNSEISLNTVSEDLCDIQIFPESGYLLEDVENTIGIKVLINGKGNTFSGKLLNSKGLEIVSFIGNKFGMSKAQFFYSKDESYSVILNINDEIKKKQIPKANQTGIIFSTDNINDEILKLTIRTNEGTLPTLKADDLNLLIYRNNYICDALSFSFDKKNVQEFYLEKTKMLFGVNIITLFQNNVPIAERKLFISKQNQETAILIEKNDETQDSISVKIQTINFNNKPVSTNLSISILPKDSKIYADNYNIKSAFSLSPYLMGEIESPGYYLKNQNSTTKYDLDLLLLTQGWLKYSLKEKIEELNPKEKFKFESGFTLNGEIKSNKTDEVGIISDKNRTLAQTSILNNGTFSFNNILVFKNQKIKFSLINKKGSLEKPAKIYLEDPIRVIQSYKDVVPKTYSNNSLINTMDSLTFNFEDINKLNEISIQGKIRYSTFKPPENLAENHSIIAGAYFYKGIKVKKEMTLSNETLYTYFSSIGYIKSSYFSFGRGPVTFGFSGAYSNPDYTFPPEIYIDDLVTGAGKDVNILKNYPMSSVDEILINKSGGGSFSGTGGTIRIYLKDARNEYEVVKKDNFTELIVSTGFDRAIDYYKSLNISKDNILNLTEIDWISLIKTNKDGVQYFNIAKNDFSNDYIFIINGFSESGLLFYDNTPLSENKF